MKNKKLQNNSVSLLEGYDFYITHKENQMSEIQMSEIFLNDQVFIVPTSIINKLTHLDIFNLFKECYSSKNVFKIQQELVYTRFKLEESESIILKTKK